MTSVRESLSIVGQSASIRQLARQRSAEFPLSLRDFVGALPPGRLCQKVVSKDFLQRMFDIFFNERIRPLFEMRLNSQEHRFGQSALTIAMDSVDGYDHDNAVLYQELAGPGESLSFDAGFTYNYYFQDLRSNGIALDVLPGAETAIELTIHFESDGPIEMKVDGHTGHDINFTGLILKLRLEFGCSDGLVDILHAHSASVDVSVDVDYFPDGVVANAIEDTITSRLTQALEEPENRQALNELVTRWLVGGDFLVTDVTSQDDGLTITYLVPTGQLEPFPESPQAPLDPGPLRNIKHIVVLMMENRSFDHMVGYLSKEGRRTDVDGLRGGESNTDGKGHVRASFPLTETRFKESPDHSFRPVMNQINGGRMDGFYTSFAAKYPEVDDAGKIMGYHTADHVPVYDALAREFMLCQRWFAAHPGPTFCNRFYTLTGRLNRNSAGQFEFDNFSGDDFKPVATRTIFDHLSDRGVPWRFYEHRYCSLRLFGKYTTDSTFIVDADDPVQGFFASAAAGTLPAVSFIDPNFIDEADGQDNDDGAPSDIMAGQNLIGRIVDAVMHSPQWNETLLVITYDEHGGFYDHVNPLDSAYRAGAKPVSGIDHYGVRVPAFVVSPWVDRGKVSNVVFDHTSIAKTIARCFMSANPPDMGERMAAANDLSMVLSSTLRQDRPGIPIPPAPAQRAFASQAAGTVAQDDDADDFKGVMRAMRARYPIERQGRAGSSEKA